MADKIVGQVAKDKPGTNENNSPPVSFVDVINGTPLSRKAPENTTGSSPSNSVKDAMRLYRSIETKAPVRDISDKGMSHPDAKSTTSGSHASDMVKNGSARPADSKLAKSLETSFELGNKKYIYDKKPWVSEVTTQVMTPMICGFAAWVPRASGFQSMLLGTSSGARDVQHFLNANTPLEQVKYGSASLADASLLSGGTLMMLKKAPKVGPTLVGIGIAGRLLADLVPNRIESLFER